MRLEWNEQKNEWLQLHRRISFEQIRNEILAGRFTGPHINPSHKNQLIIVVCLDGYPCVVPFVVMDGGGWFLKTAYKSRKIKRMLQYEI